jgi:hypothetical protein
MPTPQAIAPYAIAAGTVVLTWRIGIRLRRSVGRQELKLRRVRISAYLFPAALLLLLPSALVHPTNALAQAVGIGIGVLAARFSLGSTKFEVTEHGHFYTPNPYVGTAIVALFFARVAYRLARTYEATGGFAVPPSAVIKNPFTILVAGLVLGYYSWLSWGLLRWYKQTPSKSSTPNAA